jgi:oligopeptide transport system substrate-binding protein
MRKHTRLLSAGLALALGLAACNGDDVTDETDEVDEVDEVEDDEAAEGGEFTTHGCEPQFLTPVESREVCGGRVLNQLFSGLVEYDAETGEPDLLVATDISSDDNINWTIELRDDWTFHDGTPVTAQSYADAWAVTAQSGNNSFLFDFFEGVEELREGETEELAGVEVVDDHTLEVTLTEPFAPFFTALGDSAFVPLPEVYFDDPEAFEEAPVGNGRYMMDGEWERGQQIALQRFEDWPGDNPGRADNITYVIYEDIQTAYLDVQAGNLDVLPTIPPEQEPNADGDFGDNVLRTPTSSFTYLGFPLYDENFDSLELRQALSLAIDRDAIISAIFNDTQRPATAIIPPVLEAHREDACDVCEHDPERAQELFEEAGGWDGPMTLYFNSGAGHEDWVEAVANQWTETLGIDDIQFESLDFAEYLELLGGEEITGPYRLGWTLVYLSPQYALELYTSDSGSNYFGYASDEFDDAYMRANASDVEEADSVYQEAEDILLADLPLIPMWYGQSTSVHSDRVSGVVMDPTGYIRVEQISVQD